MANAAKRMKEKKQEILNAKLKAKGFFTNEEVEIKNIDKGTVTNVDVEEEVYESFTAEELNAMLKSDLVNLAIGLNLDSNGTKAELIDRILNN